MGPIDWPSGGELAWGCGCAVIVLVGIGILIGGAVAWML